MNEGCREVVLDGHGSQILRSPSNTGPLDKLSLSLDSPEESETTQLPDDYQEEASAFSKPRSKCFGLTIKESSQMSNFYYHGLKVPIMMYRCFTYLDHEIGYDKVGIFRLSSVKSEINRLEEMFNNLGDVDLVNLNPKPSIHAVTTLFKRWLRSGERILNEEDCMQLKLLLRLSNVSIRIREFNSVLRALPSENYQILKCLFIYLDKVLEYRDQNKNSIESLAMLFSANVSYDPTGKHVPIFTELLVNRKSYFLD
ncbi:hypothetical protein KL905_002640 [Ogataea polymorpha]|uniref:Uncharacterized protein n=1 Tax=Ogataea polymorpha TaxID=460523 RepID=A0A1B7SP85_9ASCO|nr:uncharacterized protein OGAPODRAFT_74525 [Ogataea polymorpha]KAG7880666.1 hypothetical protein KL937_002228 [Ogataea polymorpha]KAG7889464.1 hypothetical protein KL936_003038 [Ogataea polymorpha]KAG7894503.1 hypothetical protein KL908_001875 [Ogataea polymorpha]KAG7899905.1 hypothetical protein KL935_003446 [Ogataea polymorpha]KAG7906744.1 hypothetical protein KL907_002384 [Ogataea polymorpha]